MPFRYGHTLSDSRLDHFENLLAQSEARELPTSGLELEL